MKGVVFDLFGTLMYIKDRRNPYHRVLDAARRNNMPLSEVRRMLLSESVLDANELAGLFDLTVAEKDQFMSDLNIELTSATLYPDVIPALKELRKQGYETAVTSNLAAPYKDCLFFLGLGSCLDYLVFSCDVGYAKPDKRIYETMRDRMGCDFGEIIMVGDSARCDVRGPREVGINAILLDRNGKS